MRISKLLQLTAKGRWAKGSNINHLSYCNTVQPYRTLLYAALIIAIAVKATTDLAQYPSPHPRTRANSTSSLQVFHTQDSNPSKDVQLRHRLPPRPSPSPPCVPSLELACRRVPALSRSRKAPSGECSSCSAAGAESSRPDHLGCVTQGGTFRRSAVDGTWIRRGCDVARPVVRNRSPEGRQTPIVLRRLDRRLGSALCFRGSSGLG